jgi:5'-deoxynucleotidase YfbR-like HD superfamily hydrolase
MRMLLTAILLCCIATAANAEHHKPKHEDWRYNALVHDLATS